MQIKQTQKKIPNSSRKNADYNAKTGELESKIPRISGLVTISVLTPAGNKIPSDIVQ